MSRLERPIVILAIAVVTILLAREAFIAMTAPSTLPRSSSASEPQRP